MTDVKEAREVVGEVKTVSRDVMWKCLIQHTGQCSDSVSEADDEVQQLCLVAVWDGVTAPVMRVYPEPARMGRMVIARIRSGGREV